MDKQRIVSTADQKRIKSLKITQAYAQYKMRSAGDLDGDLINWTFNIMRFVENEKVKSKKADKTFISE